LVGVPLTAVPFALYPLLPMFGTDPETGRQAFAYLLGRAPSMTLALCTVVLRSYLQAHQRGQPVLTSVVVANILNFLLDYLLLFGDEGLHRLGMPALGLGSGYGLLGIGLASTIATLGQAAALLAALERGALRSPRLKLGELLRIFGMGLPLAWQRLAEVGVLVLLGLIAGRFGAEMQSGHFVSMQVIATTFTVALGMSHASATRVGRSIGFGSVPHARRAAWVGLGLVTVLMSAFGLSMALMAETILSLLTQQPLVIATGITLLHIAALFQIADGIQVVAAGILRGAGDTRTPFWATAISHWFIGLPIGLLLAFPLGLGPAGLWWGMTIAFSVASLILTIAFVSRLRAEHGSRLFRSESSSVEHPWGSSRLVKQPLD